MAGYRPVEMVRTPWGDADTLRDRKLRPGQRLPAGEVARNQRERLFAALVAVVAEKGYEGTRVEDLLELSGVSRSAFYEHFSDKQDCLLAAVEAFVGPAIGAIGDRQRPDQRGAARASGPRGPGASDRRAAGGLAALLRRDLRRRAARGRADRPGYRRLPGLRLGRARGDAGPRADAAGDRAGDDRRPAQGDPHPPLPRRGGGTARPGPADVGLGPLLPAAAGAAAPPAQPPAGEDALASRATTRRSGSCARSPRSSPRRATRR